MIRRRSAVAALVVALVAAVTAVLPAAAAPTAAEGSVYSYRVLPNGETEMTIHTPAPGVSAATLASNLRASGVENVTVSDGIGIAAACSRGTAHSWGCPMPLWSPGGYAHAQIAFINHAAANWQVSQSVSNWDDWTFDIRAWTLPGSEPCPANGIHCVHVRSGDYGEWDGDVARTTRRLSSDDRTIVAVSVQLNEYYRLGYDERRWTSCHETGHAIGLDHNSSPGSCLYDSVQTQRYPNHDDYGLIDANYP